MLFETEEKAVLEGVKIVMLSDESNVPVRFALLRRLPREERPVELTVEESGEGIVKNLGEVSIECQKL